MKMGSETAQTVYFVKGSILFIQEVARRMVDIEQDSVEFAAGRFRKPLFRSGGQRKKIGLHETAARIGREQRPERDQSALVPFDDRRERFYYNKRAHRRILQGRESGVTEP